MSTSEPRSEMDAPPGEAAAAGGGGGRAASSLVGAGILLSRITGLLREAIFARYFGTTMHADVWRAGLRMPNVLQNLLGEGTLSASFIPVYSELLEEGREEEAGRVAGAIFAILMALAGALSLIGVLLAPVLVSVFTPGWTGEQRQLAITLSRIIFPMTGFLVLSAWALGILNSHRRFFVPYVAPVVWNAAMISTLVALGGRLELSGLLVAVGWGALAGGILQFAVQLPWVFRLQRGLRISWNLKLQGVREALRNAAPAIMGRGVVQISGWLDLVLASFLAAGAVAFIGYAQVLYTLPVSLFGMAIAAAELPELSRQRQGASEAIRLRTNASLARLAFFVVPSVVAFFLLGDVVVAALYERGEFSPGDTMITWMVLGAFTVGLLASTSTRVYSSTYFALRDTRTPAKLAAVRVASAAVLSLVLMVQFEPIVVERWGVSIGPGIFGELQYDGRSLGAVGLALGAGLAAWIELGLLRRILHRRIGAVGPGAAVLLKTGGGALLGAAAGWGLRWLLPPLTPVLGALVILGAFGVVYLGVTRALGLREMDPVLSRLARFVPRRR
jgi:putative peptidoglycan lipid II flippase